MKKWWFLVGSLSLLILLVACKQSQSTIDWLEGDWHSTEWNVTVEIDEEDGKWSIREGKSTIAEDASLTVTDKTYTLTDKAGVHYNITQVSQTEILYQQTPPEGLTGATAQVAFKKIDD